MKWFAWQRDNSLPETNYIEDYKLGHRAAFNNDKNVNTKKKKPKISSQYMKASSKPIAIKLKKQIIQTWFIWQRYL